MPTEQGFVPPSDAVEVKEDSFVPPSDAVESSPKQATSPNGAGSGVPNFLQAPSQSDSSTSNSETSVLDLGKTIKVNKPIVATIEPKQKAEQIRTLKNFAFNKEQALKNAETVAPIEREVSSTAEDLYKSFEAGSAKLGSMLAKTPAFIYDLGAVPQNLVSKYTGINLGASSKGLAEQLNLPENEVAKYYDEAYKQAKVNIDAKYDKSISDYIDRGEYAKAIKSIGNQVMESAPISISLMAGNAAGITPMTSTLAGGGIFGADNKAELDKSNPNMDEATKTLNAAGKGLMEGVFENALGVTKLGTITRNVLEKEGAEAAKEVAEKSFKEIYAPVLKKYIGIGFEEPLGEAATQFSQNVIAKYSGENPDLDLTDGVADAAIVGLGSGVAFSAPVAAIDLIKSKETRVKAKDLQAKKDAIESDLSNPSIPNEVKDVLSEQAKEINANLADLHLEDNVATEGLNEDDKAKVESNNKAIDNFEAAIGDLSLSEDSRKIIEEKKNELEKQNEEILNQPKVSVLKKFTSPTNDLYGYVEENGVKRNLTKEEFDNYGNRVVEQQLESPSAENGGGVDVIAEEKVQGGEEGVQKVEESKYKTDRNGNEIGDGSIHSSYDVSEFKEYPQITSSVSKADTTESVYVTYTNNENGKSVTVRFSNHENNATKFGDQLDGKSASNDEILHRLDLKDREFIPNKFMLVETRQVSKKDLASGKFEEAPITMKEIYALGKDANISKYKGKLAKGSNYLILGDKVEEHTDKTKDYLGNIVERGQYIYKEKTPTSEVAETKTEPIIAVEPISENKELTPNTEDNANAVENPAEVLVGEQPESSKGVPSGNTKEQKVAEQGKQEEVTNTKNNGTNRKTKNGISDEKAGNSSKVKAKIGRGRLPKAARKVKDKDYLNALAHDVTELPHKVMQYFIGGGKINASAIKELYGVAHDTPTKESITPPNELKQRIDLVKKDAPSIKQLAHSIWENLSDEEKANYTDQDVRNAIEDVMNSHTTRRSMVNNLNELYGGADETNLMGFDAEEKRYYEGLEAQYKEEVDALDDAEAERQYSIMNSPEFDAEMEKHYLENEEADNEGSQLLTPNNKQDGKDEVRDEQKEGQGKPENEGGKPKGGSERPQADVQEKVNEPQPKPVSKESGKSAKEVLKEKLAEIEKRYEAKALEDKLFRKPNQNGILTTEGLTKAFEILKAHIEFGGGTIKEAIDSTIKFFKEKHNIDLEQDDIDALADKAGLHSAKNEFINAKRKAIGLDPIMQQIKSTDAELVEKASSIIAEGNVNDMVYSAIQKKSYKFDDAEQLAISYERDRINDDYTELDDALTDARQNAKEGETPEQQHERINKLEADRFVKEKMLNDYDQTLRNIGSVSAKVLRSRQLFVNKQFDKAIIIKRMKANSKDGVVPEKLEQEITSLIKERKELSEKLKEALDREEQAKAEHEEEKKKLREDLEAEIVKNAQKEIKNTKQPKKPTFSAEKEARLKELGKILGLRSQFNDVTTLATLLVKKEFYEYNKLLFERAAGDFKDYSKEMISSVGRAVKEHLPRLFKEVGGTDEQINASKKTEVELQSEYDLLAEKVKIDSQGEFHEGLLPLLNKMLKNRVEAGETDYKAITKNIYETLLPHILSLNKTEMRDLMSGYGKFKALSKDETIRTIAEMKNQMRLDAKVEATERNELPLRNGIERAKQSQATREKNALILKNIKEKGIEPNVTEEEQQAAYASALEAHHRRLQNAIDDIQKEIDTNIRKQKTEPKKYTDDRTKELEADRDRLIKLRDEKLGIGSDNAIANLKNNIDKIQEQINSIKEKGIDESTGLTYKTKEGEKIFGFTKEKIEKQKNARIDELKNLKAGLEQELSDLIPQTLKENVILDKIKVSRQRRLSMLEDKLERGKTDETVFDKKKRVPFTPTSKDSKLVQKQKERELLELDIKKKEKAIDNLQEEWRLKNRSTLEIIGDYMNEIARNGAISNPTAIPKIFSSGLLTQLIRPIENFIGAGSIHLLPKQIGDVATMEGKFIPKIEGKAYLQFANSENWKQAWTKLKTGEHREDTLYGDKKFREFTIPITYNGETYKINPAISGRMHAFSKTVPYKMGYERNRMYAYEDAITNHPEYFDENGLMTEQAQKLIESQAYFHALADAFLQENKNVKEIRGFIGKLERSPDKGNKVAAWALNNIFKVLNVSTNYFASGLEYTPVYGQTKALLSAYSKKVELTPERANRIARTNKRAYVGAMLMLVGAALPQVFGGYGDYDEENEEGVPSGEVKLGDYELPHWLTHTPMLIPLQLGATIRRAMEGKNTHAIKGIIETNPFAYTFQTFSGAMDTDKKLNQFVYDELFGQFIPASGLLRNTGQFFDKDANGKPIKRLVDESKFMNGFMDRLKISTGIDRESLQAKGTLADKHKVTTEDLSHPKVISFQKTDAYKNIPDTYKEEATAIYAEKVKVIEGYKDIKPIDKAIEYKNALDNVKEAIDKKIKHDKFVAKLDKAETEKDKVAVFKNALIDKSKGRTDSRGHKQITHKDFSAREKQYKVWEKEGILTPEIKKVLESELEN